MLVQEYYNKEFMRGWGLEGQRGRRKENYKDIVINITKISLKNKTTSYILCQDFIQKLQKLYDYDFFLHIFHKEKERERERERDREREREREREIEWVTDS